MSGPMDSRTVMIVDDHPLVRSAVARAIHGNGLTVVGEAGTAEDAIDLALRLVPDILLLDIALPGASGIQIVRELAPRLPRTKIVMLTVSTADRDVTDAMRYGAVGYLTKDVSPEALVRAVRAAESGELVMPRRLAARLVARMSMRGSHHSTVDHSPAEALTPRERDVHRLLAEGLGDRDIAVALTISRRTVETHVSSILHKLGVQNRTEAAVRYRDEG
jgi:DNA-binding NarL/FixJ family response regulator